MITCCTEQNNWNLLKKNEFLLKSCSLALRFSNLIFFCSFFNLNDSNFLASSCSCKVIIRVSRCFFSLTGLVGKIGDNDLLSLRKLYTNFVLERFNLRITCLDDDWFLKCCSCSSSIIKRCLYTESITLPSRFTCDKECSNFFTWWDKELEIIKKVLTSLEEKPVIVLSTPTMFDDKAFSLENVEGISLSLLELF
ncbi:hypothetical protein AGLY_010045 [Aphis glycines]|uniref:Uncharacterized protein n=1 Tax=Aphis glycines TaxID=307491 RepID=A0A6G0TIH0_APHGL|nr:hypothetical protein AGLY_010045 [Aphis glycines]